MHTIQMVNYLPEAFQAEPDLVLLPGDYIQEHDQGRHRQVAAELRDLLREVEFEAPLGIYAVQGNVDPSGWTSLFEDLPVTTLERTETLRLGDISVTGLGLADSFNSGARIPDAPGFHVVFGHGPDFALGKVNADLLIAGHTHGGQVRIPLFGPPITFSEIPRKWAAGATRLASGALLVVSRGVGMERGFAPRMRFLCPPELVLIDVVPLPVEAR